MASPAAYAAAVAHVDHVLAQLPDYCRRHKTTREAMIAAHIANAPALAALDARKKAWDDESARQEAADAARRATLTPHERELEDAERTLRLAEMSDSLDAGPRVAAARRHLAALRCSHAEMPAC